MIVREGKSVFKGVAIGSIFVYRKAEKAVNKVEIGRASCRERV